MINELSCQVHVKYERGKRTCCLYDDCCLSISSESTLDGLSRMTVQPLTLCSLLYIVLRATACMWRTTTAVSIKERKREEKREEKKKNG